MRPFAVFLLLGGLAACSGSPVKGTGLVDGRLQPCPAAPHCVNSTATDETHAIAPLALAAGPEAWQKVVAAVAATARTTIVASNGHYLHAEVVSPWHFYTDDLELLLVPEARRIEVRSSSRVGYYDFKVNRERIEALRARLAALGLVRG